ncbi:MAG TPA: gliding motility-associated C-terminal domain-containing protein, partial [Flavobacteriales bacterium]|nr:gliding motility-associated C-terminal domain-containing protein [Flavobacteriales bacterium]
TNAFFSWVPSISLDSSTVSNPTAMPAATTTYAVTVTEGNCSAEDSVTISVNPLPVVSAGNDITIFAGTNVELMGSGGPGYLWSPSTGLSCTNCQSPIASPAETTTYYLTVTDSYGCTATDSSTVFVEPIIANVIFVPNVFSPNHDGVNDILDVQASGYESLHLTVYDRWGEKVFETISADADWDGTFRGEPLNSATFVYLLEVVFLDGEGYTEKGNIALIR